MKRSFVIISVAAAFAVAGSAPAAAHSIYATNFLGEQLEAGDVRAIGLGGSYQLLSDSLGVLQLNPALLSRLRAVSIGASQVLSVDEGRNESVSERNISYAFSQLRAAFPISRLFVLSIGYMGRYEPGGGFAVQGETASGQPFTTTYSKSGGLFSVPLSLSFNLSRYLSLAGTFSFEAGFIQERYDTDFADPLAIPSAGFKKEEVSGNAFGAAAVFYPNTQFMVGAMYESEVDYDTDIYQRFTDASLDTAYTSTARLPAHIAVGATWQMTNRLMISGSASFRDFADFEGFAFNSARLEREQSFAFGVELSRGLPLRGLQFPLRFGFKFAELPYGTPIEPGGRLGGERIQKKLATFGTSIRLARGRGKLDFAIQAGTIGSLGSNGVEDRVVRFYFGLVGSEIWRAKAGRGI